MARYVLYFRAECPTFPADTKMARAKTVKYLTNLK